MLQYNRIITNDYHYVKLIVLMIYETNEASKQLHSYGTVKEPILQFDQ